MYKNDLRRIYKKLYRHFGPQHWWPGQTKFEVTIGAILTQNTSWNNVEKAIGNLKRHKLLEPLKLYRLPPKRLTWLIKPAGYYNIKARRLKNFLSFLFKSYKGQLKKMSSLDTQELRRQLLSVVGIGPETADSILLYALGRPVFVVDAYTKRIFSRHRFISEDAGYDEVQNLFMQNLNPVTNSKTKHRKNTICNGVKNEVKLFNEYHALLVRLGKDFCLKKRPKCEICPLK